VGFDPTFAGLRAAFGFVDDWRRRYPGFHAAFAVNEFGLVVTRPEARQFLAEELALLHGHRSAGRAQPGMSYAAWLWENSSGACFDGTMSLSADPEFLFTLRAQGWH
jgi:hypothetical protein